jgi:hypothetical protein
VASIWTALTLNSELSEDEKEDDEEVVKVKSMTKAKEAAS